MNVLNILIEKILNYYDDAIQIIIIIAILTILTYVIKCIPNKLLLIKEGFTYIKDKKKAKREIKYFLSELDNQYIEVFKVIISREPNPEKYIFPIGSFVILYISKFKPLNYYEDIEYFIECQTNPDYEEPISDEIETTEYEILRHWEGEYFIIKNKKIFFYNLKSYSHKVEFDLLFLNLLRKEINRVKNTDK